MALQPIEGQPGLFREVDDSTGAPVGPVINIRDFREGDKYDSVAIPTGTINAGAEFYFFQDIQQKRLTDTNLRTPSKLSAGESMVLDRIGLYVRSATGATFPAPQDYKTVLDNSYYKLEINGILQDEGPSIKFPSGYGLYGQTNENGQGIVSVGVPATASAARMVKKQLLNQNHELLGTIRFDQRPWLLAANGGPFTNATDLLPVVEVTGTAEENPSAGVVIVNLLHGLIRSAVTK
jgi:hypothetical protein